MNAVPGTGRISPAASRAWTSRSATPAARASSSAVNTCSERVWDMNPTGTEAKALPDFSLGFRPENEVGGHLFRTLARARRGQVSSLNDLRPHLFQSFGEAVAFALGQRTGGAEPGGGQRCHSRRRVEEPCARMQQPGNAARTPFDDEDATAAAQHPITLAQQRRARRAVEHR